MTNWMRKCVNVIEGKEDRISNLPIEIIDDILDCMPLRDAARSSILSRKWRQLWSMHAGTILFLAGTTPIRQPIECLKHLTLNDLNFTDVDHISTVTSLLQGCPNLRFLDIKVSSRLEIKEGDAVLNYLDDPNCMKQNLVRLKIVKIFIFKNPIAELRLLKLLLARSPSLDVVFIEENCCIDCKDQLRIGKKILSFPQLSRTCRILWDLEARRAEITGNN